MDNEVDERLESNIYRVNENIVRSKFENNCVLYFPPNRFEEPAWLNEGNLRYRAEFVNPTWIRGTTVRKVINYSSLRENLNWLYDIIYDSGVFELVRRDALVPGDNGTVDRQQVIVGSTGRATDLLTATRQIIQTIDLEQSNVSLRVGPRQSRTISLVVGNEVIVPNVFQLSSGQTSLLNLFLTILRDFDLSGSGVVSLEDVKGIVIVDEVDVHLHTMHQYEILPALIKLFPKVQFIVTTHSPLFILGMAQTLGENGFGLYRMPQGQRISPEEFTEFGEAYRAFTSTSKFSDDIRTAVSNAQTPILYLEGKTDVQYIRRAAELLGQSSILAGIEIDEREGGGNLKNIWEAVKNLPTALVPRKVMLLHDSDFTGDSQTIGNRFRRKIPFQADNPIERGIENLFSRETLLQAMEHKPDLIDVTEAHPEKIRGIVQTVPEKWVANEDEKANLCMWLCANGTGEDFRLFQVIFDLLEEAFGLSKDETCNSA